MKKYINKKEDIPKIFDIVAKFSKDFDDPLIEDLANNLKNFNCFDALISTLLSLRSRDIVTKKVFLKLRERAKTPYEILDMPTDELENTIKSIGFYKNKAKVLKSVSKVLIKEYAGSVPEDYEKLLNIKGVGRKTANLVASLCFNQDHICVDTHVHRLTNRLFLHTKDTKETEFKLMKIFPKNRWNDINLVLVKFGQNHCRPEKPDCKNCPVTSFCEYYANLER